VSYRNVDIEGDTISAYGEVTGIESLAGDRLRVELALWIENQRGERSTEGSATVTR